MWHPWIPKFPTCANETLNAVSSGWREQRTFCRAIILGEFIATKYACAETKSLAVSVIWSSLSLCGLYSLVTSHHFTSPSCPGVLKSVRQQRLPKVGAGCTGHTLDSPWCKLSRSSRPKTSGAKIILNIHVLDSKQEICKAAQTLAWHLPNGFQFSTKNKILKCVKPCK